jgi:hypothetical protein
VQVQLDGDFQTGLLVVSRSDDPPSLASGTDGRFALGDHIACPALAATEGSRGLDILSRFVVACDVISEKVGWPLVQD